MMRLLLTLLLAAAPVLAEPVDNCASLLGSLSVELRVARSLPSSARSTFTCPRDTRALVGASRQRVVNALGAPDHAGSSGNGVTVWTYYFSGGRDLQERPAGTARLSFEFDPAFNVARVTCERVRAGDVIG